MAQETVNPRRVQQVVKAGFQRLQHYRRARAMFIKAAVGPYYAKKYGLKGEEPINLIFSALRAIVPNVVNKNPLAEVSTEFVAHEQYAEMLSFACNQIAKEVNLKETLRAWVVSAMFGLGVTKTGLAASGTEIGIDGMRVDPGEIYTTLVDLDNFVIDPTCTSLAHSSLYGDRIQLPRQYMLDTDGFDHDLVKKLPSARRRVTQDNTDVASLTQDARLNDDMQELQDEVNVVELWVPGAESKVIIPDPFEIMVDNFLHMTDYYGPEEGPYDFLSFTPPIDNNPLPVAPVSLFYDLHRAGNRVFSKIIDQMERQRNVLVYDPAHADAAQDILDSKDGDAVASTDPTKANVISFDGTNPGGVEMLGQLQVWFNYMAGNPDQLSGSRSNANTATQAQILQSNAAISLDDARDILYDGTARITKKHAWYVHTDPLLDRTMKKREQTGEVAELHLTPEQRQGDFFEYMFRIVPRSMGQLSPEIRAQRIVQFATNIIPSIAMSTMQMAQLGLPFNVQKCLTEIAQQMEIGDWVQSLFVDPMFEQKMQMLMMAGPQNAGKAGTVGGTNMASPKGIMQQGGFPGQVPVPGQETMMNQEQQMTAGQAQSANQGVF